MRRHSLLLAVMVFAGLVQVESRNGTHLLGVGERRVFGQEDERRPERQRGRRTETRETLHTVVEVQSDKLTITSGRRGDENEQTLDVDKTVKVLIDGKEAKLGGLGKGMLVRIEKNDKGDIVRIAAEGPTIGAKVKAIEAGKITLENRGRDEEDPSFPVAKDAKIVIDRQEVKLADVKPGTVVLLKLSADRKTVLAISSTTERRPSGFPGRLVSMDEKEQTITLTGLRGGEKRTLTLDKDVRVVIDGKEAKVQDLKVGSNVMVALDREGKVRGILVGRRVEGRAIRGIVTLLNKEKMSLAAGARPGDFEETFDVGSAKVFVDGKPAKLAAVDKGTIVALDLDDTGSVTAIHAEGPMLLGMVKELQEGKITVVMRSRSGRKEQTWNLAANAKREGVSADMAVALRLSVDRKTLVAIIPLPQRGERGRAVPAVTGTIKSVDGKANTITLAGVRGGEDRTFTLAAGVRVLIDGKVGKVSALKPGGQVALKLDSDGKTVVEIIVPGERRERERER